ncbi:MAG: GtrA family protein [Bacilli bacterium]|nr:GtrA family protein [Bacilli bacterium]
MKKKLVNKYLKFIFVSGIGWLIDFTIFITLSTLLKQNIFISNIISSIPAITWVFIISTKKIFDKSESKRSLQLKYIIYLIYQIILIVTISWFGNFLYNFLKFVTFNNLFINNYGKIIIKIIITPITMTINYYMMRYLTEKI